MLDQILVLLLFQHMVLVNINIKYYRLIGITKNKVNIKRNKIWYFLAYRFPAFLGYTKYNVKYFSTSVRIKVSEIMISHHNFRHLLGICSACFPLYFGAHCCL